MTLQFTFLTNLNKYLKMQCKKFCPSNCNLFHDRNYFLSAVTHSSFSCLQERLTASGHGSLTLSGSSPGYGAGGSGAHHRSSGALHHSSTMQHQLPQPDFQPPYFPPPFHHPPSPPPQQHLEYLTDPYGGLSGLHHYNQLGLRPREGDPNHTHVVS